MTTVHPKLREKLIKKLGVSQRRVNQLIDAVVRELHLSRQQAAIVLASRNAVNFSRFATPDDLAAVRDSGGLQASQPQRTQPVALRAAKTTSASAKKLRKTPSNSVFVVHGRDERIRRDLFQFLRDVGLNPIEWTVGKQLTKKASPHNAEVLAAIMKKAAGAVVLFCPEEEATLKTKYRRPDDPAEESKTNDQPRPNVLYEAGMAFARFPASTVIVRVGRIRQFTDLAGVQIINLTGGTPTGRKEVAAALQTAKLPVDTRGSDWLREGGFTIEPVTRKNAHRSRTKTRKRR